MFFSILFKNFFYSKRHHRTTHFGSEDKHSRIKLHHISLEGKGLRLCMYCYLQYI